MNNIFSKSYEIARDLKKIIKEKINNISIFISNIDNFMVSKSKNYILIEIRGINDFSYKENDISNAILGIDINLLINNGDSNLLEKYGNDLIFLLKNQENIKNVKITEIFFDGGKFGNNLDVIISIDILLKN